MTQYLMAVHHAEGSNPYPSDEDAQAAFAATGVFNDSLQAKGVWVFAGGLHPASTATVVDNTEGKQLVTDGPFVEAKEQLGGFWVIEVPDLDTALGLAQEASAACRQPVEVRPFQG